MIFYNKHKAFLNIKQGKVDEWSHEPIIREGVAVTDFEIYIKLKTFRNFCSYLAGPLSASFVPLGDLTEGRFRYSNSDVTDTVDFVFKLSRERGDTKVTLRGIMR